MHKPVFWVSSTLLLLSTLFHSAILFAQSEPPSQTPASQIPAKPKGTEVAATVGNHDILVSTVQKFVEARVPQRNLSPERLRHVQAEALEHLVRRAVIADYLASKKKWAGDNEVRLELDKLEQQLKRAESSIEEHLKENEVTMAQLEFEAAWRMSWQKYLAATLTDQNLQTFYDSRRHEFDGSEMKVAHLLIKHGSTSSSDLSEIHASLKESPTKWNELVKQHSEAASRNEAGVVGWIGFEGPMPPAFTEAAFRLKVGEISEPVETVFGKHLIRCLEVRKGKIGMMDARVAVIQKAKSFLFFKLSKDHRPKVNVTYTDRWPHH